MVALSLAMIVRNEERTIGRILAQAARFCEHMVVVDTGSTDRTVELAQQAGAEVHHLLWRDDFAAARNHAFSLCRGEWVIWLDADDVVPPPAQRALCRMKDVLLREPAVNAVLLPYHLAWSDDGQVREQIVRERILRRAAGWMWHGRIHERLQCPSEKMVSRKEAWVEHRPHSANLARKKGRDLAIYESFVDLDRGDFYTLYQYACELQWNDRYCQPL